MRCLAPPQQEAGKKRGQCARLLGALAALCCCQCAEESHFAHERRPFSAPRSAAGGQLLVLFPELDQRIQRHEAGSARRLSTLYPDLWEPDTRGIRDFALDEHHAFLLISRYGERNDDRLLVVELPEGSIRALPLPPNPQRLAWSGSGELLVGHFSSHGGGPGKLSVVDTDHLRLLTVVELQGACLAATGDRSHAFVIERMTRRDRDGAALASFGLADVDLDAGKVVRRLPLPAGARQVTIGPTGLLYVAQASGTGTHATDGTISVYDPGRWQLVDRIKLDMVVRRMRSSRELLLLNLLSTGGEAWFGALRADHQMLYDFRLPELVTAELALIDNTAYLAGRGEPTLIAVDLAERPTLRRISMPDLPRVDRVGLLRTVIESKD